MFSSTGGSPGDTGRGACWGQDVAGQTQAQGATIFLKMELLADADYRQPQGTKEGKDDFGSLHSLLGRKSGLVTAETLDCLGWSCFRTVCWAALNVSFVTELGLCHGSAPTTCFFSVLPALPWPMALAGREGDEPLAGWQNSTFLQSC